MRDGKPTEQLIAAPPPPPPPPAPPGLNNSPSLHVLAQQEIPQPRNPTKRLAWNKIPVTTVVGRDNLWADLSRAADVEFCRPDFGRIEQLFSHCRPTSAVSDCSTTDDTILTPGSAPDDHLSRRRTEVNLIDNKRSMNVNIFLRQFSGQSYIDVVSCLRCGNVDGLFDPDRLRSLLQILPDGDDIERLNQYHGDRECLGLAERFYLELMSIPNYELLIDALLLKLEFQETLERIKVSLDSVIVSAQEIKQNKALQKLIHMVLVTGNFLNAGHYGGNAAGFRLDSLLKLKDLRSNTPGINLMHVVAQEASEKYPGLIEQLQNVLRDLHDAAGYPLESLTSDIKLLRQGITSVLEHITHTESEICQDMAPFFESADDDLKLLCDDMKRIESLRVELAEYFCEDVKTFKLDDCIGTFNEFCQQFLRAIEENNERAAQQQKAEQRRRQRESKTRDSYVENDQSKQKWRQVSASDAVDAGVLTKSVPPSSSDVISAGGDDLEQCLLRRATDSRWSGRQSRSRSSGRFGGNSPADLEATSRERPLSSNRLNGEDSGTPSGLRTSADVEERPGKDEPGSRTPSFSRFDVGRSSCPSSVVSSCRKQRLSSSIGTEHTTSDESRHSTPAAAENLVKPTSERPPRVDTTSSRSGNKSTLRKKDSLGLERTSNLTVKATSELSNSSIDLLTPCLSLLNSSSQQGSAKDANDAERRLQADCKLTSDATSISKCREKQGQGSVQNREQQFSTKHDLLDKHKDVSNLDLLSSINTTSVPSASTSTVSTEVCVKKNVDTDGTELPSEFLNPDTPRRRSLKEKFKRLSELYSDSDGESDIISGYSKTMRLVPMAADTIASDPAIESTVNQCQKPEEHVTLPANPTQQDVDSRSTSTGQDTRKSSMFSVVSDEGFDSDTPRQDGGRNQPDSDRMSISSSSSGFSTTSGESGSAFAVTARPQQPHRPIPGNSRGVPNRVAGQTVSASAVTKTTAVKEAAVKKTPPTRGTGTQSSRPTVENLSRRLSNFMLATASSSRRVVNQPPRSNASVVSKSNAQRPVRDSASTVPTAARKTPSKPVTPVTVRSISTSGPSTTKSQSPVSSVARQTVTASLTIKTTTNNSRVDQKPEAIERPRKPRPPTFTTTSSATPFVRGTSSRSSGGSEGLSTSGLTPFVRNAANRSSTPASLTSRGHELSIATFKSKGNVVESAGNSNSSTGSSSGRLMSRPSRRDSSVGSGRLETTERSRSAVGSRSTGTRASRVSDQSPAGTRLIASTSTTAGNRSSTKGVQLSRQSQQQTSEETSSCNGQQQEQVLYRTWVDSSDVYYV